jgi:hypothetical protein
MVGSPRKVLIKFYETTENAVQRIEKQHFRPSTYFSPKKRESEHRRIGCRPARIWRPWHLDCRKTRRIQNRTTFVSIPNRAGGQTHETDRKVRFATYLKPKKIEGERSETNFNRLETDSVDGMESNVPMGRFPGKAPRTRNANREEIATSATAVCGDGIDARGNAVKVLNFLTCNGRELNEQNSSRTDVETHVPLLR